MSLVKLRSIVGVMNGVLSRDCTDAAPLGDGEGSCELSGQPSGSSRKADDEDSDTRLFLAGVESLCEKVDEPVKLQKLQLNKPAGVRRNAFRGSRPCDMADCELCLHVRFERTKSLCFFFHSGFDNVYPSVRFKTRKICNKSTR